MNKFKKIVSWQLIQQLQNARVPTLFAIGMGNAKSVLRFTDTIMTTCHFASSQLSEKR